MQTIFIAVASASVRQHVHDAVCAYGTPAIATPTMLLQQLGQSAGSALICDAWPLRQSASALHAVVQKADNPMMILLSRHAISREAVDIARSLPVEIALINSPELEWRVSSFARHRSLVSSSVLRALVARCADFPLALTTAIVGAFCHVPHTTADFVTQCNTSRRTVDRALEDAQVGGLAALMNAARVARALDFLVEPISLQTVASIAGFHDERNMQLVFRRVLGCSVRQAGKHLSHSEAVERILARYQR